MNAVTYIASRAGVSPYLSRWLPPDLEQAYNAWSDGPEFVRLLAGVGFDADRIADLLLSVATVSPIMDEAVRAELYPNIRLSVPIYLVGKGVRMHYPVVTADNRAYNAASALSKHCNICDLLRAEFPLPEFAAKVENILCG